MTILILSGLLAGLVFTRWFFRCLWFERSRYPIEPGHEETGLVWPVDGTIVYIKESMGNKLTVNKNGREELVYDATDNRRPLKGRVVGVYMSPFDRHSVIATHKCLVTNGGHISSGRNLPMLDLHEYIKFAYFGKLVDWAEKKMFGFVAQNEKLIIKMSGLTLVCIADRFVDKIDLFKSNQVVQQGDIVAHIRRGSQTDIFIPYEYGRFSSKFHVGDRVKAGTYMGERTNAW